MRRDLISPRLKTVKDAIAQLRLFLILLESMIIFIFAALILTLIRENILIGFLPAIAYFSARSFLACRDDKTMTRITHKSPSLSERLQTAYDNRKESNIIAERLLTEVSTKLDSLSTSSFFERQALSVRVAAIIVLLFGLLTINFVYIQQFGLDIHRDINRNLEDLFGSSSSGGDDTFSMSGGDNWQRGNHSARDETQKIGGQSGGKIPGYAEGPMPGSGGGVGSDASNNIYGAPTSVKIAGEEKPMEIHPEYGGVINIEDDSGEETSSGNYDVPEEIESAGMPEQEPVEYAEVIKSYWEKLSAGEVK